ncbi:MAG: hypothetical protein KDD62_13350, partial [Bdellovibrionales bacterium]|nr:hypothetical protein [Bdellovibrionales bacterium]
IGITLVALGTSLPELATTILAALKNEGELAIGNAIGSNIFNVFCVLGVTAGIQPLPIEPLAQAIDIPLSVLACFLGWMCMRSRAHVGRLEGGFMLGIYGLYVIYLFMRQTGDIS